MSEEVATATADTLTDLQSQLASAHESLAIAEATITLWREAATALLHGRTYAGRGAARVALMQLLREPETGKCDTPSADTIAERAQRFNRLLGPGPGREASE